MSRKRTAVVKRDNTAESVCPHCGNKQIFKVETRVSSSTPVRARVRCKCGRAHAVYLERRAFVRKEVSIPGVFLLKGEKLERRMTIYNLSRTGVMFRTEEETEFEVGDRMKVDFCFGNQQMTHIHKQVRVIRVADHGIGAEFFSGRKADPLDHVYDLALALYQPE